MKRLEMIDDVREYANCLMATNANLSYDEAYKRAKLELFGRDLNVPKYKEEKKKLEDDNDDNSSYTEIANREFNGSIRTEFYTEDQLKEIIIAKRMGVNVVDFVNIFYTPEQIRVITMASALGRDISPYINNLYFDAEEELRRLEESES